jgi:hypothetical protein
MDYHGWHGIGKDDITAWQDSPFHYHVEKSFK